MQIEPIPEGSRIRIQLAQQGLAFREMRLLNPPRVVLDILAPKKALSKAAPVKPSAGLPVAPKPERPRPSAPRAKMAAANANEKAKSPPVSKAKTAVAASPASAKGTTGRDAPPVRLPARSSSEGESQSCEVAAEAMDRVRGLEEKVAVLQARLDEALRSASLANRKIATQLKEIEAARATK